MSRSDVHAHTHPAFTHTRTHTHAAHTNPPQIEAAISKVFASEAAWQTSDDAIQVSHFPSLAIPSRVSHTFARTHAHTPPAPPLSLPPSLPPLTLTQIYGGMGFMREAGLERCVCVCVCVCVCEVSVAD